MGIAIALWWVCAAMGADPATLRVGAATAARGSEAAAAIAWDAGAGPAIAAVEWVLSAPSGRGIESLHPKASPAAAKAGKSLSCTGKWKKGGGAYEWTCILAGGGAPIPPGEIATAGFRIAPDARAGSHTLSLERVKAVDAGARTVAVRAAAGRLSVE
jgi:hypothetical protein